MDMWQVILVMAVMTPIIRRNHRCEPRRPGQPACRVLMNLFGSAERCLQGPRQDFAMSNPVALTLKRIFGGWAVCLPDGRELARFRGPGAGARALQYALR
jgi:hypothetical protein